jgi:release factor glutamine methyltransferase
MTIRTALQQACGLLEGAGVSAPRLTAEVLLAAALERERAYLYAHPEEELAGAVCARFESWTAGRAAGRPTQYITGRQEFYGREFLVTPDVLIPRPETEHLVETALRLAAEARSILDVGCGSGAIAITLSLEMRRPVWTCDISRAALLLGRENARRLGAPVGFAAGDLASAFRNRSLDLLISNPPYVAEGEEASLPREVRDHEPRVALFAGPEGLDVYRRLVVDAERVLKPGGRLIVELGRGQAEAVRRMLAPCWREVTVGSDLAGIPRVLAGRLAA